MFKIAATALSALALSGAVAMAAEHGQDHELEFPMNQETFLEVVPDASIAVFETIDTQRDGMISEAEFEHALEAGLIEDPRG